MTADNRCAVVIPAYRDRLSPDESLSLQHLEHYLPDVDKIFVMPRTLALSREGYREEHFADAYFDSVAAYSRLMLSRDFYARFDTYEYILLHQLDAIVLDSDLERFAAMGVDYLGAPWVDHDEAGRPFLTAVGNGGLSLRNVGAFQRLLDSPPAHMTPRDYYRRRYAKAKGGPRRRLVGIYKAALTGLGMRHSVRTSVRRRLIGERYVDFAAEAFDFSHGGNEDDFIAAEASLFSPGFRIGSLEQALQFAFEREPRFCYAQAGRRMPFGAHAWAVHDRGFWQSHLLAS